MRVARIALLVRQYDEAIAWYTRYLGFELLEDTPLDDAKRWVVLRGQGGAELLLAQAAGPEQQAAVGKQAGGRVFLFLETDDFSRDHAAMLAAGVGFREQPRREAYGIVAVFADLYGNLWDLIEPKRGT